MGRLRDALLSAFGARFVKALAALFAVGLLAALAVAALKVRDRRLLRYGGLLSALALVPLQGALFGTGIAEVDVVERIHLLEYGLLALLLHRALATRGESFAAPLALLLAAFVGVLDELVQWWVPLRTGDVRDVALDAYAALAGLVVSTSLGTAALGTASFGAASRATRSEPEASRRRLALAGVALVLGLAAFLDAAHLGYEVADAEAGRFLSFHERDALVALRARRAADWKSSPPSQAVFGREDFYATAAGWHVARRNEAIEQAQPCVAWRENRILELYFDPFLDLTSTRSGWKHRLPPERRDVLLGACTRTGKSELYVSSVLRGRIFTRPRRSELWLGAALAVLLFVVVLWRGQRVIRRVAPRTHGS